jgi:hypothetical protein
MAYWKAKLNSNGDKASPCFKPFLIENLPDKFLPTRILLYVNPFFYPQFKLTETKKEV